MLFRTIGDRTMEAWSLPHARHARTSGSARSTKATRTIQDALRLFHASGDVAGITLALDDLASVAVARGDLPRAARLWGAARALSSAGAVGLADFVDEQFDESTARRTSATSSRRPTWSATRARAG